MDQSPGLAMDFLKLAAFFFNERKKNLTHAHQLEKKMKNEKEKKYHTHTHRAYAYIHTHTTSIRLGHSLPHKIQSAVEHHRKSPENIVHDTEQLNSQSCDAPCWK